MKPALRKKSTCWLLFALLTLFVLCSVNVHVVKDAVEKHDPSWGIETPVLTAVHSFGNTESVSIPMVDLRKGFSSTPPQLRPDCKVILRDPKMGLCHIIPWGSNFGDEIGPAVIRRVVEYHFGCSASDLRIIDLAQTEPQYEHYNSTCLFSVGSVWQFVRSNDHVWGTGQAYEGTISSTCLRKRNEVNMTVYASRGPDSAKHIKKFCSYNRGDGTDENGKSEQKQRRFSVTEDSYGFESFGDPGFLMPFLFPEFTYDSTRASKKYCVIPHYFDRRNKKATSIPNDQILNVQQSWQNMTQAMMKCKYILSSSLHGLVLADAFGIPSRWFKASERSGWFKFNDYFHSFADGGKWIAEPCPIANMSVALKEGDEGRLPTTLAYDDRLKYALGIIKSFPFHLFSTESTPPLLTGSS